MCCTEYAQKYFEGRLQRKEKLHLNVSSKGIVYDSCPVFPLCGHLHIYFSSFSGCQYLMFSET